MFPVSIVLILCFGTDCREVVAARTMLDNPATECVLSQPMIAQWKAQSYYVDDVWVVKGYRCEPGNYIPKEST